MPTMTSTHIPPYKRARGRPKKTEDERDDGNRRQALISVAAQLFKLKGYDATSTREIASKVGMHAGSPFYHFENKQDLLLAVMVEGMTQAIARQHRALDALLVQAEHTPRARLQVLVRHHFDVLLGPDSDFIPVMLYEGRSLNPAQVHTITQLKNRYEAPWIPVLQTLHDNGDLRAPVGLARLMIFGALNWSVQWYEAPNSSAQRRKGTAHATLDDLTQAALLLFLMPLTA
jgi:AcrR family transcriptional regulator